LYKSAIRLGVKVLSHTRVISIDPGRRSVTLTTGKTFCADVIIGADGPDGVTRTYFPESGVPESAPVALAMFQWVKNLDAREFVLIRLPYPAQLYLEMISVIILICCNSSNQVTVTSYVIQAVIFCVVLIGRYSFILMHG